MYRIWLAAVVASVRYYAFVLYWRHLRHRKYPILPLIGSGVSLSSLFPANQSRSPAAETASNRRYLPWKRRTIVILYFTALLSAYTFNVARPSASSTPPSCSWRELEAAVWTFKADEVKCIPGTLNLFHPAHKACEAGRVFFLSQRRRADDAPTCRGIIIKATKSAAASNTSFSDSTSCFG